MLKRKKVLLVDDEPDILDMLQYIMEKEGFEVEVANDGETAIEKAMEFLPNIILLDIMMPKMDGIETCYKLREMDSLSETIIIFLTSRSEEYSEIAAFEAGANDFIVKPIKPRALVSRISAYFRHENKPKRTLTIAFKDLVIDKHSYTVFVGENKISLAKKEFDLLYFLSQHPNKTFNRDEILKKVWGGDVFVVSRTVDVHIRKIREKIGEKYISTIKGVGYKFEADL